MISAEFSRLIDRATFNESTGWWFGRCPAHKDDSPSFEFRDGAAAIILKCFRGCTRAEIIAALNLTEDAVRLTADLRSAKKAGLTVESLAASKGFAVDYLASL